MSIEKTPESQLGGLVVTTFVVGLVIGAALVIGFKGGSEGYWKQRAESAESQIENAQRKATEAEAKYNALITGAAITK